MRIKKIAAIFIPLALLFNLTPSIAKETTKIRVLCPEGKNLYFGNADDFNIYGESYDIHYFVADDNELTKDFTIGTFFTTQRNPLPKNFPHDINLKNYVPYSAMYNNNDSVVYCAYRNTIDKTPEFRLSAEVVGSRYDGTSSEAWINPPT